MRKFALFVAPLAGLAALTMVGTAPASSATTSATPVVKVYRANLGAVPHDPSADGGSDASGTVTLVRRDNELTVVLVARGLSPNLPHAVHIHGVFNAVNECPTLAADANRDGLIDTLEGLPSYGPIDVSFTTTGATGGNLLPDGLDLSRFPVATRAGTLSYHRTFTIPANVAQQLGNLHIVVHGDDLNGNGVYDGKESSLSALVGASVPLEAELPVGCGPIVER